ncbi:hypothetical protein KVT40_006492 [Elsinoe batatas]|uniref:Uncharacterized protein n=1 Tax=Elsinoe batatas TaxID=2601811 RepID=A0A8K0L1T0_9PEZI|nr:hypothetical protein KVT40_006492 [Elsinoe batatas]
MDQLLQGAKSILDSVYPEISSIATFSIPTTVVIDGSTYRIPAIALPTPSTTSDSSSSSSGSSSTPSSTSSRPSSTSSAQITTPAPAQTSLDLNRTTTSSPQAPTDTNAGHSPDRRLGIILGVTLSLLAILIAIGVMWFAYRRKKRTGYWLKHKPPPSDEEVDTWRDEKGVKEKPTSSFFVRPLNHTSHIWSEHGASTRYQPITNSAPHMASVEPVKPGSAGKGDPWTGASGLPGGTGATRISEREVAPDGSSVPLMAGAAGAATGAAAPAAAVGTTNSTSPNNGAPLNSNPNPFSTSPPKSSPLSQPPITAPSPSPPPMPTEIPAEHSHTASRTAAAAGLGGLAGLAAARHARKSSSHSRSRSRGHPRPSTENTHPAFRPSLENPDNNHSSSDSYHTPPEDLAAEMTVNDGPYARARRASWGEKRHSWSRRRSSGGGIAAEVSWRQSRDMEIAPVPDPYMSPAGARRSWGERTGLDTQRQPLSTDTERIQEGERNRAPTPLMHAFFGKGKAKAKATSPSPGAAAETAQDASSPFLPQSRGRSDTVSTRRSTISRKPVPAPIQTDLPRGERPVSNPFASPADEYAEHSPGPYGGSPVYAKRRSSGGAGGGGGTGHGSGMYARGDYEEDYGPAPLVPTRSPQRSSREWTPTRRESPRVHYPSGQEVGMFDFGLTKEELRGLREAGGRPSGEGGRTWSFERGEGV